MTKPLSIQAIEKIYPALQGLGQEFVFVGGATLPFYLPETLWPKTRPTNDVDVVLKMLTRIEATKVEKKLLKLGFENVTGPGAPVCRFTFEGVVVDVLGTDVNAMGFKNRWYTEGFDRAISVSISESITIKIFTVPYFLASKIEAFRDRGKADYRGSKDMEDIISLLEATTYEELEGTFKVSSKVLREYLKAEFSNLLAE